jgi:hypothetical protein
MTMMNKRWGRLALWVLVAITLMGLTGFGTIAQAEVVGSQFFGTGVDSNSYFLGPVSIGTTNVPVEKLYVNGDASIQGAVKVPKQGDVSMGPYTNGVSTTGLTASNLAIRGHWVSYDGDSEGLYVTSDGRVGIGTNNPASPLTVQGIIQSTTGGFKFPDGSTQTTAVSFVNTIGGQNYTNGGFILQGRNNINIVYSNGVNYIDGSNGAPDAIAFLAYKTNNQSVSASTWTKVTFTSEVYDAANDWYVMASNKVVIRQDCKYQMTLTIATTTSGDDTWLAIYRNTNSICAVATSKGNSEISPVRSGTLTTPVLNVISGDVFEAYFYKAAGATAAIAGGTNYTWWSGWVVH